MSDVTYTTLVVVGDVHGCLEELLVLMDSPALPKDSTFLFLGDLVDRGPLSSEVVELVRRMVLENRAVCVMGNHDHTHVRYRLNLQKQAANPEHRIQMRMSPHKLAVYHSLGPESVEFLSSLPYVATFSHNHKRWVAVHAGLEPGIALKDQDKGKMTHIRYLNPSTNKLVSLNSELQPPEGSVYWTERHNSPLSVVYGHMVHSMKQVRIKRCSSGALLVGADTGVCFGGTLSAVVFQEGKEPWFVSVPAVKQHTPHNSTFMETL